MCLNINMYIIVTDGRATAQAVSRRLPTSAARVLSMVRSREICGQSGIRADFLQVLRFPLPILIPLKAPRSLTILSSDAIQSRYSQRR
jgi:hypothetical protein